MLSLENHPQSSAPLAIHKIPRAYLVGIGGAGMRSLAKVLHEGGWNVSGSDLLPAAVAELHYDVAGQQTGQRIADSLDLVIHSDAVPRDNPELCRARELGLQIVSYPRMLSRLMNSRVGVAIAGTHGKSTTTAMTGEILRAAGLDPTVVCGAEPIVGSSGSRFGRGRMLVAEACEYRENFLGLKPWIAAILAIERDHFDCFATRAELEQAFTHFAGQIPRDGYLLVRADCAATRRAVADAACDMESFGATSAATWQATSVRERRGFYSFQIRVRERLVCDVKLGIAGRHNVLNALAAAALASQCGATGTAIRAGLERFAGLKRRLELVGDNGEIALLDDYAHHPTEVVAALAAVRQMYPGRRLWCVFQPHQVSRTTYLLDDFAASLENADRIVLADIYRTRETPGSREVTSADLARRVAARGTNVVHLASAEKIEHHLQQSLEPGDVVVAMGAGDIGSILHDHATRIRKSRQAG